MKNTRNAAVLAGVALAALALSGCSSSTDEATASPAAASASAAPAEEGGQPGTPEMTALCDQMIADGLTTEEATALAEENGYTARVGNIDGEPQAVTMDLREDRFTFDVEGGVVVACTYG